LLLILPAEFNSAIRRAEELRGLSIVAKLTGE